MSRGRLTRECLLKRIIDVRMNIPSNNMSSGMGHSACLEELDAVEAFLRERLPPAGESATREREL